MMWILHIIALFVFLPALFLTIPMHIIIAKMDGKPKHESFKLTPSD